MSENPAGGQPPASEQTESTAAAPPQATPTPPQATPTPPQAAGTPAPPPGAAPPPVAGTPAPPPGRRSGILTLVGVGLAGLLLGGILGGGAVAAWQNVWGDADRSPGHDRGHSRMDDRGDRGDRGGRHDRLPPRR